MGAKIRFLNILGIAFSFLGLAAVVLGLRETDTWQLASGRLYEVPGVVTYVDGYGHPFVKFLNSLDEREYLFDSRAGGAPAPYSVGETTLVIVSPYYPYDAEIASVRELDPAIPAVAGAGGLFALIGIGVLAHAIRRQKQRGWLRRHGVPRWALVEDIRRLDQLHLNGRHPYVVHAIWRDEQTGQIHIAESEFLWRRPNPALIMSKVRVFVDPQDPNRHLVDLR